MNPRNRVPSLAGLRDATAGKSRTEVLPHTARVRTPGLGQLGALTAADRAAGVALYNEIIASPHARFFRMYINEPAGKVAVGSTTYPTTLELLRDYLASGTGAWEYAWALVGRFRQMFEEKKAQGEAQNRINQDRAERFRALWNQLVPHLAMAEHLSFRLDVLGLLNHEIRLMRVHAERIAANDLTWFNSANWEQIFQMFKGAVTRLLAIIQEHDSHVRNVLTPLVTRARDLLQRYGSYGGSSSMAALAIANLKEAVAADTPQPTGHYDERFYGNWIRELEAAVRATDQMAPSDRDRVRTEQEALRSQLASVVAEADRLIAEVRPYAGAHAKLNDWMLTLEQAVRVDRASPTGQYSAAWYRETIDGIRAMIPEAIKSHQEIAKKKEKPPVVTPPVPPAPPAPPPAPVAPPPHNPSPETGGKSDPPPPAHKGDEVIRVTEAESLTEQTAASFAGPIVGLGIVAAAVGLGAHLLLRRRRGH